MSPKISILKSLYFQVLIAIILAIIFGHFYPTQAAAMKPLGDGFIKLIKMIIGPVIFCTIVSGITGMESKKGLGRIGLKMFIYFEILTTLALIIGFTSAHLLKPGVGMNIDLAHLDASQMQSYTEKAQHNNFSEFLLNIIPNTLIDAFAKGEILPILLISILLGFVLLTHKEQTKMVIELVEQVGTAMFKIVNLIMRLAPIGAFGAMSFTIGKYGISTLTNLGFFVLTFYGTCVLFIFLVLGLVAWLCGFNIWHFLKYIKEELFVVLGTSSSESALPNLMKKLENLGCKKSIVGLVVPTGYSFNLDGTCIYFTLAIIFLTQAINIDLSLTQELTIILVLLLTSKGAAGVTGSGFITLAATLSVVGDIPLSALAIILGVDRFMSEARALTNIIGNGVATLAIAKWEKGLDEKKMKKALQEENI